MTNTLSATSQGSEIQRIIFQVKIGPTFSQMPSARLGGVDPYAQIRLNTVAIREAHAYQKHSFLTLFKGGGVNPMINFFFLFFYSIILKGFLAV